MKVAKVIVRIIARTLVLVIVTVANHAQELARGTAQMVAQGVVHRKTVR